MACKLPVGSLLVAAKGFVVFFFYSSNRLKKKCIGKFFVIKNNPSVIRID